MMTHTFGRITMASLSWDQVAGGSRRARLLFILDGERHAVRLGAVPAKVAEAWKRRIEELVALRIGGCAMPVDLATWLKELPEEAYGKLVRAGLVEGRQRVEVVTLAMLTERFIQAAVVKEATAAIYRQTVRSMHDYFGADTPVATITAERGDGWRRWLSEPHSIVVSSKGTRKVKQLAVATQSRRLEVGRQILARAVRWGMVARSPLEGIRGRGKVNTARQFYVADDMIEAVLVACPDAGWRATFALARWAGLRVPSELVGLCWGDVDWERNALRVKSPKTEHHAGGESRLVPVVPRLRRLLDELWELAPDRTTLIVPQFQNMRQNLRTHSARIIERAGLTVWPKPFQNMRSSRETDWLSRFPVASVAKWMGHSPVVSMRHYAQALPEHFNAAVADGVVERSDAPREGGAQCGAANPPDTLRNGSQRAEGADGETNNPRKTRDFPGIVEVVNSGSVGATRFERATSTSRT
jgi:integrase